MANNPMGNSNTMGFNNGVCGLDPQKTLRGKMRMKKTSLIFMLIALVILIGCKEKTPEIEFLGCEDYVDNITYIHETRLVNTVRTAEGGIYGHGDQLINSTVIKTWNVSKLLSFQECRYSDGSGYFDKIEEVN